MEEKIKIKENERIDDVQYNGLKIIQNKNRFLFWNRQHIISRLRKKNKEKFRSS